MNLDVRKADQQLRGSVLLPNGTGKSISVLVVTNNVEKQKLATACWRRPSCWWSNIGTKN
nr:hypothetical protein [Mycoplasmopsis bovis]